MLKPATAIWALLAIGAGIGQFLMNYEVRALEGQLDALNRDIARNRQAVHVLKAEWSFLNRPGRIEDLGRRLLRMTPLDATQITTIDEIPMRTDGNRRPSAARSGSAQTAPPAADHKTPHFAGLKQAK